MSLTHSIYLLFLLATFSQFANADLIDNVCSKARIPSLCQRALRSDPRSRTADLKGLAQIAIDVSKAHARTGVGLTTSLLNRARDFKTKEIYKTCVENYSDTVETLNDCMSYLNIGDFFGFSVQASAALNDPGTCDDGFTEGGPSSSVKKPAPLKALSNELQGLINVILVITNILRGS